MVGIRADGGMCVRDVLRHRASSRSSGMHAELYLRPAAITAAHIFRFLDLLHSSDDVLHFATAAAAVGAAKEDALALRVGGARPRSTVVLDARSGALVVSSSAEESEQRAALAYARRGASFRSSSSTASRNSREFQVQVQGRGAAWAVAKSGGGDGGGDSGGDGVRCSEVLGRSAALLLRGEGCESLGSDLGFRTTTGDTVIAVGGAHGGSASSRGCAPSTAQLILAAAVAAAESVPHPDFSPPAFVSSKARILREQCGRVGASRRPLRRSQLLDKLLLLLLSACAPPLPKMGFVRSIFSPTEIYR